jgi:hypothetical protein
MDTNNMSGGGDGEQEQPVHPVPERPTPSGWVVVKKARKAQPKAALKKKAAPAGKKRSSGKRELIDTGRNKMYAKRGAKGRFKEMDDVSRSLSADRRKKAKTKAKSGYGDQGDGAKRGGKKTARKPARKIAGKKARSR